MFIYDLFLYFSIELGYNLLWNQYVYAFFIFISFLVVARIIMLFLDRYIKNLANKTKNKVDSLILEKIRWPFYYFFLFFGAKIAFYSLDLSDGATKILGDVFNSVLILIVALSLIKIISLFISSWVKRFATKKESTLTDELLPLTNKVLNFVILVLAAIYILQTWGLEVGPLFASLGIVGLAIGLALKDSLSNIISGIILIFDRAFKVGDTLKISSGETGRVLDIGLRSTKLMTFDGEVVIIPNSELTNSEIINYAKPDLIYRMTLFVNVVYGSDVKKVKKVLLNCINILKNELKKEGEQLRDIILDDEHHKIRIYFVKMDNYSLKFEVIFWIRDYRKRLLMGDRANSIIYNELKKSKIEIAFPTRTIYIRKKK